MNKHTKEMLLNHFKNQRGIAAYTKRTPAAVCYWFSGHIPVPAGIAQKLAEETGLRLVDIRPDLRG